MSVLQGSIAAGADSPTLIPTSIIFDSTTVLSPTTLFSSASSAAAAASSAGGAATTSATSASITSSVVNTANGSPASSTFTNTYSGLGAPSPTSSSALCTIALNDALNFDYVSDHEQARREIYYYTEQAIVYALNLTDASQVYAASIISATVAGLDYLVTLVHVYLDPNLVDNLEIQLSRPESWLHQRTATDDATGTFIQFINGSWPLQQGPALIFDTATPNSTIGAKTTTSTMTTTTSTTPVLPPVSTDSQASGLSSSGKIGVGAGIGLGGAVIILLVAFVFWRRRPGSKSINKEKTGPGIMVEEPGVAVD